MLALSQIIDAPWTRPRIAILEITGPIGVQVRAPEMIRTIKALREDKRVQAVVIDIDSPGGSAPVSDAIHRAVQRLSAKKPTIAFVGSGALSGGYLIACGAQKIIALPTALVGSIGVIFTRPVVRELMEKVGVKMVAHHQGHLKAMFQPWQDPSPEEIAKIQQLTEDYYGWFVNAVAEARNLPVETVREIATGEMYNARRGKDLGLVDELADFEQALDRAREAANVSVLPRLQWVRPRRPMMERLLSRGMTVMTDSVAARIEERIFPRIDFR